MFLRMKPISGFERPWIQWLFIALSVVLIGLVAWQLVVSRRQRKAIEQLHRDGLNARVERGQLESRLAREHSAREALGVGARFPREIAPSPSCACKGADPHARLLRS